MLRQAFFGCSSKGSSAAARRWLTAATSSQKRALNPDQIRGASPQAPPLPPPPAAAPITFAASSGGGNSFLFAGGAVSLLAGAGAYYYYSTMNETKLLTQENTTELLDSVKSENGSSFTKESAPQESFPKSSEVPLQSSQAPILEKKTTTGNRVVSIAVPSKMKNSGTKRVAVTTPAHPEFGNRVSDLVPRSSESISEPPMDDTTMTVDAVEALRDSTSLAATEAVLKSHQSLWTAMDESFFHDLDSLTTAQLKARVMQLASELKDRTKWEAVRLKEFLAMKEKETADK